MASSNYCKKHTKRGIIWEKYRVGVEAWLRAASTRQKQLSVINSYKAVDHMGQAIDKITQLPLCLTALLNYLFEADLIIRSKRPFVLCYKLIVNFPGLFNPLLFS